MRINTYTLTRYRQFLQVNHAWYTWFIKWWSHLSERVLITCQCGDKDVYCITKEDACCCHFLWPHARLCIPFSVPLFSGPPLPGILFLKVFHSSFWGNHAPPSFPTQGQFLGNSLPWGISILFLFTCLAGKVADMLVTCCPDSQMPAHTAATLSRVIISILLKMSNPQLSPSPHWIRAVQREHGGRNAALSDGSAPLQGTTVFTLTTF